MRPFRSLPLIVTHGGDATRQYRNVLDALEQALASEADMFEFDVRIAADGVLVVHHDAEIAGRALTAMRYDEAAALTQTHGYALPLFADVLARARGRIGLDVELKVIGIEDAVLSALADHGFTSENTILTSFEAPAIRAVHSLDPSARTGLLVYDVTGGEALDAFHASGAAFLGPDVCLLDSETLSRADANGVPLLPWTINDVPSMERLLRAPAVMGVITDRPWDAMRVRGRIRS